MLPKWRELDTNEQHASSLDHTQPITCMFALEFASLKGLLSLALQPLDKKCSLIVTQGHS